MGKIAPSLHALTFPHGSTPGPNQFVVFTLKMFSPRRFLKAIEALIGLVDEQKIRGFYTHPRFRGRFFIQCGAQYLRPYALFAESAARQLFVGEAYFISETELVHNLKAHQLSTKVKERTVQLRPGLKILFKPPGAINLAPKLAEIQELQGDLVIITMLGPKKFPLPVITSRANIVDVVEDDES